MTGSFKCIKITWIPKTIAKYEQELNIIGPEKCPEIINDALSNIKPIIMNTIDELIKNFNFECYINSSGGIDDLHDDCIQIDINTNIQIFITKIWKAIELELGKIYTEYKFNRFICSIMEQIDNKAGINYINNYFENSAITIKQLYMCNSTKNMNKIFHRITYHWIIMMISYGFNYDKIIEVKNLQH